MYAGSLVFRFELIRQYPVCTDQGRNAKVACRLCLYFTAKQQC